LRRALATPDQGRRQLQAVSGAQFMSIEEPPGETPQVMTREDLSAAGAQESKLRQSSLLLWITQLPSRWWRAIALWISTSPPNNWQESS